VSLNLSGATDPLPKNISYIFIKHSRLTKIQNHTNIVINYRKKIHAYMNKSYEVLKHICCVLRYGHDQEVVNFLTETVANPQWSVDHTLKLTALVYSNTWRHFHSLLVYSIMLLTTYVTLNDRTTGEGPFLGFVWKDGRKS
jgi:hypothetical protein